MYLDDLCLYRFKSNLKVISKISYKLLTSTIIKNNLKQLLNPYVIYLTLLLCRKYQSIII